MLWSDTLSISYPPSGHTILSLCTSNSASESFGTNGRTLRLSPLFPKPSAPASPLVNLCLVAAKVLYFGVGGGISDFIESVEKHQPRAGTVESVLEKMAGVGRKVLRVRWPGLV